MINSKLEKKKQQQQKKKISLPFPVKERPIHLAERLYSMYNPGHLETDPNKIAYTIQYGTTKEIPRFSFAFELMAVPVDAETIRKDPTQTKSEFFGLVNSSYAALGTRFDGSYHWFRKKNGREAYGDDIVDCLQQCGFVFNVYYRNSKNKIPCAILGNLISQRVDYTEKSKAKMDASPFVNTIIEAVEKVASKVPTYKSIGVLFASDSDKYRVSSRPRASTYYINDIVEMMLLPRIKKVKAGGKITTEQTQDSLWYNALPLFEQYYVKYSNDSRAWFKTCIRNLCKQYDVARELIGIIASPWGSMYFNGQWYDISFDTIKDLAKKGTDIIFIEKRDIVMALGKYASKWGVALVNTHGILSDYTEDLAELAAISGAHIALLTDYDIPGLLIASDLGENVPRLGVDERMLEYFDIDRDDKNISIPYKPKVDRLKEENLNDLVLNDERFGADMVDIEFLKHEKIEIDAILARVGAEKLWLYLQELLKEEFPTRNYLRVINPEPDLSKHYPPIIQQLKLYYDRRAREITEQESKKIAEELKDVEGFIDVKEKEKEILDDRLGKIVLEDQLLKDVAAAFVVLDGEKGYGISEIEVPAAAADAPTSRIKSNIDDDNIPDPPIDDLDIKVSKGTGIKPITFVKFKIIKEHGSEEIKKRVMEWKEEEEDETWRSVVNKSYKEVIRQYKEQHNQRLPWEEEQEQDEGGGSEK